MPSLAIVAEQESLEPNRIVANAAQRRARYWRLLGVAAARSLALATVLAVNAVASQAQHIPTTVRPSVAVPATCGLGAPEAFFLGSSSGSNFPVAGDLDGDGDPDLVVSPGYGITLIQNDAGTLSVAGSVALGEGIPLLADLDQDGDLDIAQPSQSTSGQQSVAIAWNQGAFVFSGTVVLPTGVGGYAPLVTTGDFNGDGLLDLAAIDYTQKSLSVITSMGGGAFAPYSGFRQGVAGVPTTGDFDGDGDIDILAGVTIIENVNSGQDFRIRARFPGPPALITHAIDVDGDNDFDVVGMYGGYLHLWVNHGPSGFQLVDDKRRVGPDGFIEVADIDGDGSLDVIAAEKLDDSVVVFRNITPLGLGLEEHLPVGNLPQFVAAADFDGDGLGDIVVLPYDPRGELLLSRGKPLRRTTTDIPIGGPGSYVGFMVAADINRDGRADIISADAWFGSGVSVALARASGEFAPAQEFTCASGPVGSIAAGDLDNDGWCDVVATSGRGVFVFRNQAGVLGPAVQYPTTGLGVSMLVGLGGAVSLGDFDGDGDLDIVVGTSLNSVMALLTNAGGGSYTPPVYVVVGGTPAAFATGDFDGNGVDDIISVNPNTNSVSIFLSQMPGMQRTDVQVGSVPLAIAASDVDADGDLDIAVVNRNSSTVSVLLNNGSGVFAVSHTYPTYFLPQAVAFGDVDGDGVVDLVTASPAYSGFVSLLRGAGQGLFRDRTQYVIGRGIASGLASVDFDGNGVSDLAVAAGPSGRVRVMYSDCP